MGTDVRPMVGTSKTYQGKEVEMNNDSKIGGLSPGPMYYPRGKYDGNIGPHSTAAPKYSLGSAFKPLGIPGAGSPGPANYEKPVAASLGAQRINSFYHSQPVYGMGSATREHMDRVHLAPAYTTNLSSRALLGGAMVDVEKMRARPAQVEAAPEALPTQPASRTSMSRALGVVMQAAKPEKSDPMMTAALLTLKHRVAQIDRRRAQHS